MVGRIALLVDLGFAAKRLRSRHGRPATVEDLMAECRRLLAHPDLSGMDLLRI